MPVTIRLQRAGSRKNAFFHLVACDSRNPRDGRFIERLGYYDPKPSPSSFVVDRNRLDHWLGNGAKTTRTVAQLLAKDAKKSTEDTKSSEG